MEQNFETLNRKPTALEVKEAHKISNSLHRLGTVIKLSVILSIIVAFGVEKARAEIATSLKNTDEPELFNPMTNDLIDNTYMPDKDNFLNGEKNIQVSAKGNFLMLDISDSLFQEKSFPILNVGVDDGKTTDMPIMGELLNESGELKLSISLLMGDKDFARIVIWVENTGGNDAKRIISVQRNTDGTFRVMPQSSENLLAQASL
jgi:hypothetical protein